MNYYSSAQGKTVRQRPVPATRFLGEFIDSVCKARVSSLLALVMVVFTALGVLSITALAYPELTSYPEVSLLKQPKKTNYAAEVLGTSVHEKVLLTSVGYKTVQIWLQPLSYSAAGKTWAYEISWNRRAAKIGSIAINSNYGDLLVPAAPRIGSAIINNILAGSKVKVEFFAVPNADKNSSKYLLVRKHFTALPEEVSKESAVTPSSGSYSPKNVVNQPPASSQRSADSSGSSSNSSAAANNTPIANITTQVGAYYWGGQINNVPASDMVSKGKALADNLRLNVIRITLSAKSDETYRSGSCIANFSLADLAARSDFKAILQDPQFTTVIITAYDGVSFPDCVTKNYLDPTFFTPENIAKIKQEYTDLANYLKQFNKTFIIDTWETDNEIYCNQAYYATESSCPGAGDKFSAYKAWLQARTKGISAAGAGNVKTALEINNVHALEAKGLSSALTALVPDIDVDYVSYSSYESTNISAAQTAGDIDFIRNKLSAYGKDPNSLFFGEIGFDTQTLGYDIAAQKLKEIIDVVKQKNIPYAIVWNLIDNPGFGIYNTSGVLTVYGKAIAVTLPGDIGSPPPPPPPVTAIYGLQGFDANTFSYTNNTGYNDQYLILYGRFSLVGNTVYVNNLAFIPTYESTSQINVKLDSVRISDQAGTVSVYVSNVDGSKTGSVDFTIKPHLSTVSISAVQGYNANTYQYTNGSCYDDQYLVLFGKFLASGNTVYIDSEAFVPIYESTSQINVKLDRARLPGSLYGKTVQVYVSNSSGQNTSSVSFYLLSLPNIAGAQGYNASTYEWTNWEADDEQYLILYGEFFAFNNTVYVDNVVFVPIYQSFNQINVKLSHDKVSGSQAGNSVSVYVKNSNGTATAPVYITLYYQP